jgi:high affinity Mn2+ porin
MRRLVPWLAAVLSLAAAALPGAARAQEAEDWSVHGQVTGVSQGDPGFPSLYRGQNSLSGDPQIRETLSGTAYFGRRMPWQGGALYVDPEFNQGAGLSHTVGAEGYPNGEAQKAGFSTPKPNVARLFLRQTIGFGGAQEAVAGDLNQLAGTQDVSRLTVTAGKFAATDIFDNNQYAHDPRTDFLNWSLWEAAAWDYPADQKGYTDGVAVELNQKDWALRAGYFLVPKIANERDLDPRFLKRYGTVAELETRHEIAGEPGKLRFLVFANRAPQASLDAAIAAAEATGLPPETASLRRDSWKVGFAINLEQSLTKELGLFSRLSWNDGHTEGWSFTDIDHSISAGLSLTGGRWQRPDDTVGLGLALNMASGPQQQFLAQGGTGILAGDGRLSYSPEAIIETYYRLSVAKPAAISLDYQLIANPAFNRARGPVSVFATRVHLEF